LFEGGGFSAGALEGRRLELRRFGESRFDFRNAAFDDGGQRRELVGQRLAGRRTGRDHDVPAGPRRLGRDRLVPPELDDTAGAVGRHDVRMRPLRPGRGDRIASRQHAEMPQRLLAPASGGQASPELLDRATRGAGAGRALRDTCHRFSLAKPTDSRVRACEAISPRCSGPWFDSPEGIGAASGFRHPTGSCGVDTWI